MAIRMTLGISDRAEFLRLLSVSTCCWGRLIDDALLKDPSVTYLKGKKFSTVA